MNIYNKIYLKLLTQSVIEYADPTPVLEKDEIYNEIYTNILNLTNFRTNILIYKIIQNINKKTGIITYNTIIRLSNDINRLEAFEELKNCFEKNIKFNTKIYRLPGVPRNADGSTVKGFSYLKSDGCPKLIINDKYGFVLKGGSGRANSTENSNIVELLVCIGLFLKNEGYNINFTDFYNIENCLQLKINLSNILQQDILNNTNNINIFVNNNIKDKQAALNTIKNINLSNNVHIRKIKSAINILQYIITHNLLNNYNISNIYWTYRAKPDNINKNNPSDIIIKVNDNKYIGFSLKSGILKENFDIIQNISKEPKINSTINKFFENINAIPIFNTIKELLNIKFLQLLPDEKNFINKFPDLYNQFINNKKNICDLSFSQKLAYKLNFLDSKSTIFTECQKFLCQQITNYINNNQQSFKKYFIQLGLGIINNDSQFLNFFVIKGSELNNLAIDITPSNNILKNILQSKIQTSMILKQTINIKFIDKLTNQPIQTYNLEIRTQHGCGCAELPNLKFITK